MKLLEGVARNSHYNTQRHSRPETILLANVDSTNSAKAC